MKLLVDMNLSPRWVGLLTGAGVETTHWSTVGAMTAPDTEIMAFALANDFVVLTHDLDFSAILAATHGEKPSVVLLRADDVSPDAIGRQMIIALRQMRAELQEGALVTIDPNRTRLRVLPLQAKGREDDFAVFRIHRAKVPGCVGARRRGRSTRGLRVT